MGCTVRGMADHSYPELTEPRTAIVTGSDSGIGRATAVALAHAGMDVGITWHSDEEGAEETARLVRQAGRRAVVAQLDTTDAPACGDVVIPSHVKDLGRRYSAASPHVRRLKRIHNWRRSGDRRALRKPESNLPCVTAKVFQQTLHRTVPHPIFIAVRVFDEK